MILDSVTYLCAIDKEILRKTYTSDSLIPSLSWEHFPFMIF